MEKWLAGRCILCLIVGLLFQEILLQSLARDLGVILQPVPLSPMRILGAILYELVVGITGQCRCVLYLTSAEWDSERIALNVAGPIDPSLASVGSEVNGVDS